MHTPCPSTALTLAVLRCPRVQTNVGRQLKEMLQIPDQAKIGERLPASLDCGSAFRGKYTECPSDCIVSV